MCTTVEEALLADKSPFAQEIEETEEQEENGWL